MKKIIHIHAKCDLFEIFEQIAEETAVNRLIDIREFFRQQAFLGRKVGNLVVNTRLVNPTLF